MAFSKSSLDPENSIKGIASPFSNQCCFNLNNISQKLLFKEKIKTTRSSTMDDLDHR